MTLSDILVKHNKTTDDIEKIYHGKDNWCRCGCGGRYFEPGDVGFNRALKAMEKETFDTTNTEYDYEDFHGTTWVNIPELDKDNKCYCVYFK